MLVSLVVVIAALALALGALMVRASRLRAQSEATSARLAEIEERSARARQVARRAVRPTPAVLEAAGDAPRPDGTERRPRRRVRRPSPSAPTDRS